jgi:hypothetical protein
MAMKAKPPHTHAEILTMLSATLVAGGGQADTQDATGVLRHTHRGFDGDPPVPPPPLPCRMQVNPEDHDSAAADNRQLAIAIQTLFTTGTATWGPKGNYDKFVLTWRMYPKKGISTGSCGCGCGCG